MVVERRERHEVPRVAHVGEREDLDREGADLRRSDLARLGIGDGDLVGPLAGALVHTSHERDEVWHRLTDLRVGGGEGGDALKLGLDVGRSLAQVIGASHAHHDRAPNVIAVVTEHGEREM